MRDPPSDPPTGYWEKNDQGELQPGDDEPIRTEGLDIGNTPISATTVSVADDDVAEINVKREVMIFVFAENKSTAAFLSDFDRLSTVALSGSATNQGSSDLTGTTGTDGATNYSRDGNILHIENRTGDEMDYDLVQFND
jgi:hypothetical protein